MENSETGQTCWALVYGVGLLEVNYGDWIVTDKQYCIYSKIIAVLGCAGIYLLTGSMWSMLCLLLSAYMDRELKEEK